jgi:hypothetical protein
MPDEEQKPAPQPGGGIADHWLDILTDGQQMVILERLIDTAKREPSPADTPSASTGAGTKLD